MRGGLLHDEIDMRPVRLVRRGQIVIASCERRCERVITIYVSPVIGSALVAVAEGVTVAEQFYPQRVESSLSPIRKIRNRV